MLYQIQTLCNASMLHGRVMFKTRNVVMQIFGGKPFRSIPLVRLASG
jgi:hypothetical protein